MRRENLCGNDNRASYSDVSLKILLVCGKYLKNMMSYRYIPKDGLEHVLVKDMSEKALQLMGRAGSMRL